MACDRCKRTGETTTGGLCYDCNAASLYERIAELEAVVEAYAEADELIEKCGSSIFTDSLGADRCKELLSEARKLREGLSPSGGEEG